MRHPRSDRIMLGGMVVLILLYLLRLGPFPTYPAFGDDNSHYLVSAKALAQGEGYRMINSPEKPYATLYPIGYPAVISIVLRVVAFDRLGITLVRLISLVGYLVFVWLSRRLLRRYVAPGLAAGIALAIGITPLIFEGVGDIMSEAVFAPLIVLSMILTHAVLAAADGAKRPAAATAALCGVCVSAAMVSRTIGFTFVAGIAVTMLLNRKWRSLPPYMIAVTLLEGSWLLWSATHRGAGYSNYAREFGADFTWRTPFQNLHTLLTFVAPGAVFPPLETLGVERLLRLVHLLPLVALLGLLAAGILLWGLISLWKRADPVAICFTFYMMVVLLWPWTPDRFMIPVMPLCAILMIEGMRLLARRLAARGWAGARTRRALVGLILAGAVGAIMVDLMRVRNLFVSGHWGGATAAKQWQHTNDALNWLKANTPADALIITPYPYATYLFTGRQTASQDWRVPLAQVIAKYRSHSALYLCAIRKENYMSKLEYGIQPSHRYMAANPGRMIPLWASGPAKQRQIEIYSVVSK